MAKVRNSCATNVCRSGLLTFCSLRYVTLPCRAHSRTILARPGRYGEFENYQGAATINTHVRTDSRTSHACTFFPFACSFLLSQGVLSLFTYVTHSTPQLTPTNQYRTPNSNFPHVSSLRNVHGHGTTHLHQPENQHIHFNVDVKVQNDPARLFGLMHKTISAQPDWETKLAPRILIGMWHPTFLPHAKTILPYCKRSYIGQNVWNARNYFWDHVDAFSMNFGSMTTAEGEQ